MSVLIKGMEMPASCLLCPHHEHGTIHEWELYCGLTGDYIGHWDDKSLNNGRRPDFCPLVEVPTPHGRLIDEDAFIREINNRIDAAIKWGTNAIADRENETRLRAEQAVATFCEASLTAKKMPTIIEAEEGEEA